MENACACLSLQKIVCHGKKWTKWSNFTLNQQKVTTKTNLMALISNKLRKKQNKAKLHEKKLKNQLVTIIKNKIKNHKNTKKTTI
ncbi:hypothetical protein FNN84_09580 [Salmonella enterica subsp. salamae]|uniref:Uncharacterized protein n=1 Tax=Salmonella enterica subsp. salamae TaxID=59202 RepID=A0A5Y2S1Q4_SALER|nr:hypothetical protein [Salmonella enterica subsp. salamae]ECJ2312311.1 hypothetical protein [Salmonella enterica subsp. salamae]